MKKVVLTNEQTVSIDTITNDSFVGLEYKDGARLLIMPNEDGRYFGMLPDDVFYCEGDKYLRNSVLEYVKTDVATQEATPFVFDTFREACIWSFKTNI